MKRSYTDIHHHILYGIDDGAQTIEDMHAMLRNAHENGIGRIVATPHVTPGVERFNREQYDRALHEARAFCARENLQMEIYGGAEILYTEQTPRFLTDGRVPTMAGTDFVLVEFSPNIRYEKLYAALTALSRDGFLPIVAHVERYECLTHRPARLEALRREMEVFFQVNCGTIIHRKDMRVRHFIKRMMDQDLIDVIATDAHRASLVRMANMNEAWQVLKHELDEEYANDLTDGHLLFEPRSGEEDA